MMETEHLENQMNYNDLRQINSPCIDGDLIPPTGLLQLSVTKEFGIKEETCPSLVCALLNSFLNHKLQDL